MVAGNRGEETLLRLTADGRLNQNFGSGGIASMDTTPQSGEMASDVLVDPDGRILMAARSRRSALRILLLPGQVHLDW